MLINESTYVEKAEKVMIKLVKESESNRHKKLVTTSKIRNLLAMTSDIYNNIMMCQNEQLDQEMVGRIEYLRVRFMYECGREPSVKAFVDEAELLTVLKQIGKSKKNYILFSRYMEALVAFRKYYGKQDE